MKNLLLIIVFFISGCSVITTQYKVGDCFSFSASPLDSNVPVYKVTAKESNAIEVVEYYNGAWDNVTLYLYDTTNLDNGVFKKVLCP